MKLSTVLDETVLDESVLAKWMKVYLTMFKWLGWASILHNLGSSQAHAFRFLAPVRLREWHTGDSPKSPRGFTLRARHDP